MVPPASHRISRVPWYSGTQRPHARKTPDAGYGALTPSGTASQPFHRPLPPFAKRCAAMRCALQPRPAASCETPSRFGLLPVRSPLLGESRTTLLPARLVLMSTPRGTEMFQFPRCPSVGLCIQPPMTTLSRRRVAPFGSAWLIARLQLPRHVSPLSAPFLGTWPLRHPPYTLLRLAVLVGSVLLCSLPAQQPSIRAYPQRRNSLRFGKIEVNLDIRL